MALISHQAHRSLWLAENGRQTYPAANANLVSSSFLQCYSPDYTENTPKNLLEGRSVDAKEMFA